MIKVNILNYIKDRIWFGLHFRGLPRAPGPAMYFSQWEYLSTWRYRLYPCVALDSSLPDWWINIFAKFSTNGL